MYTLIINKAYVLSGAGELSSNKTALKRRITLWNRQVPSLSSPEVGKELACRHIERTQILNGDECKEEKTTNYCVFLLFVRGGIIIVIILVKSRMPSNHPSKSDKG